MEVFEKNFYQLEKENMIKVAKNQFSLCYVSLIVH